MTKNTNSKQRYDIVSTDYSVSVIEILNLFVICLPAVFLAGCLLFEISPVGSCVLDFCHKMHKNNFLGPNSCNRR